MKLLRLFLALAWITIFGSSLFAQAPNLEFNLRYSTALSRYEVYARPTLTQPTFNWGPSQISVVAPASVADAPFNVTSVVGGAWLDNSNVYAPAAAPSSDFHGIGSLGAPTSFTANVEKLIFHFTLSGGGCTPGLRLFINGVDPDSGAPGMFGGDFSNTVFAIVPGVPGGYEAYIGNYNNTGTSCNAPPMAVNDVVTTNEDTPATFNPLANDTDDGALVPATLDLDPSTPGVQTTFTVAGQGTFVADPVTGFVTFTPVLNYNGTTTPIPYSICDNGSPSLCATATITVNVTPVNDPPVAVNDAATTNEDTPVTITILSNDSDVDGSLVPSTIDLDPSTAGVQTTFTVAGQGTFTVNPATGVVTFTPVLNYNGTTTPITYSVCDNGTPLPAQCASATITVTVTPVNDPPVALNDVATTNEDTPVTITILSNDSDVDGALVPSTVDLDPSTAGVQTTFTVAGQGTYTVNAAGVVTFTPVLNYNGTTTPITYSVCDNGTPLPALCATATITVTVTPVNDPPVAVNDVATTNEDTPVTINILSNDSDVDGALVPSTVDLDPSTPGVQTTFTTPGQGTFTVNAAGVVTFTPVLNYNGTTTPISYSVCDNGTPLPAQCATATITVTVTPVNDPPVAVNDTPTTNEDTPVTFNPLTNDTDVDGTLNPATLDLDPTTAGIQTTFTVAGQGTFVTNPVTGQVTFTPVTNYNGTTTPITYSICDTGTPLPSLCATATITVTVTPVNDPPVANNDVATTNEDTPVTITILSNDSDLDGALVPSTIDLDPSTAGTQTTFTVAGQGTFTVNAAGVVTFTPVLNYNGTTTPITYSVCDNGTPLPAQCASATITVTVTPVNDPPVAVNDVATTNEDTPVNIAILSNDTDVDGALVPSTIDLDLATPGIQTSFTVAGQGTFTVNAAGVVTFTPVSNYNGTTTPISYNVCDNGTPVPALCATATITVTVTPVNDPPVAINDTPTTNEDTPVTFNPLTNDSDVDGTLNPATLDLDPTTPGVQTTFTVPGQGTFVANPVTGLVTFTPVLNYNGTTTPVPYSICDNGTPLPAQCATATITVTVTPVNDPPVAVNDAATTPEDTPVNIAILSNDTDVDGALVPSSVDLDPSTAGVQTTFTVAGQGTFTVNAAGVVTFTPVLNYNGTTTPITYSVCDNGTPLPALCASATITVTVTPANDPPTISQPPVTTPEDTPIVICPTIADPDLGNTLTISLCNTPANGVTVLGPGNCITFTPNLNYNGVTNACIQVCDQGGLCATVNVPITVTPVNDPPVAVNDAATTPEDTPVTISVTSNDTDVDGAINPATLDLDPTTAGIQTTFTVAGQGTFVANPVTGQVTFTPVSNYNGTTTPITYNVCDNGTPLPALCASATITVTVTPANDPPTISQPPVTTPEDTPIVICPTIGDPDLGNVLTISLCNTPANGVTVLGPGNCITFTPNLNYNGVTNACIQVCDQGGLCATVNVPITVTPVNDPPVAVNDVATTPEDTPVTISVTGNDTDVDGAINPATLDLDPATPGIQTTFTVAGQGTYVANPVTGQVIFTPVLNYNGPITPITYNVCDNGTPLPALCASATITVMLTPVNDPPVAVNDVATTPEDTPITFSVTGNDTDIDGAINPATLDLDPATPGIQTTFTVVGQGTYVANPVTGQVTFTPVLDFSGTTTPVTYSVCDNGTPLPAQCATATITVTVIFDPIAKLQLKVMLQGALIGTSNGLMRDDLRAGGYLPLTEPYTALANTRFTHVGGGGGETTTAAVLAANAGTPDAIVDWVFVELRNAADSSVVLQTRSALVQRDGDVVSAADGVSKLNFTGIVGQQYFISVKHRNHLGAMTAAKVAMNNNATVVDFVTATNTQVYDRPGATNYNGAEMVTVQGIRALWAGNTNANTKVKYQGTATDNTTILTQVLGFAGNTAATYNYNNAFGYFMGDVNMDGKVKYQGTSNDASYIFVNVIGLYTTLNTALLYNYDLFLEQLP
jgi:CshA-type fibril repeat protein